MAFMEGLTLLQEKVATEKRPLSWVVGSQDVVRAEMPSRRELKREKRRQRHHPAFP